jgi:hypothetical protein
MRFLFVVSLFLCAACYASAQDFVCHTVDGPLPAAPLGKIGEDWSVRLAGKTPRLVPGGDLVSLRRQAALLPDWPRQNFLLLTSGDRVPIDPASSFRLDDDRLFFRLDARLHAARAADVSAPLAYVSALVLAAPGGDDDPDQFLARLSSGKRPADLLLLKNGDRIEGKFKDISRDRGCFFDIEGRKVETPLGRVAVLAVNTNLQAKPRVRKPHALLVLQGGGRIHFTSPRLDSEGNILGGKTLAGFEVELPLNQVVAIDLRQGRAIYLSDLTPKFYEHRPFLGLAWPLAIDRCVADRPLRLGKDTFDKGLGMHAPSRVTYALDSTYRWFETTVGLDARMGKRGQVRVSVLVDGKEHMGCAGKELTGTDPPLPLRVDVRKASELTLVVELGNFGDVQAHVNWADARLIRE